MAKTKTEQLKDIRDEIWNFSESPLYEYRTKNKYYPVLGEGDHNADVIFIGEAPGKNEAEQGVPFCGASGRILDELLASINLDRSKVYVTNIVKDRPPENRDPTQEEIQLYAPFLRKQIEVIQPKVIATLGRFSMEFIFKNYGLSFELLPISKAHGVVFETEMPYGAVSVIPLYHPAVALYNASTKGELVKDFKKVKKAYENI